MSSPVPTTAVVVDTDAFSRLFVKRQPLRELRDRLIGRVPVVATQTKAELLAWPRLRSWGSPKARRLHQIIDSVPTVPVTDDVVHAYVDLLVGCTAQGHALGQKDHTGDRWIAATAIALDRPLFSLDGIFRNVPGLTLL